MQATVQKKDKCIIIMLALLINLLLVLPLILMKIDTDHEAFVVFKQEPEVEQLADAQDNNVTLQEPEELIEHILSSGMVPVKNDEEIQHDMPEQPNLCAEQAIAAEQLEEEPQEELAEYEPEQEDIPEEVLEEIEKAIPHFEQTTLAQELPESLDKEIKDIVEEKKEKIKKPKPQENKPFGISLGLIAQGFIKSMQQEEGLNNPQMDAERLAAHQYATKIWNIIKNSFKADANMLHLSHNVDTMAYLVITLTQKGELVDIHLEAKAVNPAFRQIESLITSHARRAGLFPPLPKRFNVAQKTFTFPLRIQGEQGYHSYRLSYGRT